MKKLYMLTKKIFTLSALFVVALLFFSCGDSAGLGAAIDQTAPVINITSHSDNDTVPTEFTLKGSVWDNEKVSSFTVDFDDADLHYKIVPGSSWYKKTSTTDWVELSSSVSSCSSDGLTWNWSVLVDTSEAKTEWTDTTYEFTAVATDPIGNSGKKSKVDCSLVVDTKNPDVSIYKPDLFKTSYDDAYSTSSSYSLNDGNVISRLLNGDISLSGRQSGSVSFKELLIEFDDGSASKIDGNTAIQTDLTTYPTLTSPTAQEVSDTVMFTGESEKPQVYYSKLITEDSRSWDFTVSASEWVSDTKNPSLQTGSHLIRVVASSVSHANAWEKKVLGYFLWWPEADAPWITTYSGDDSDKGDSAYEVYPSSNFSGTAQDDDGIKSLSYVIEKKDDDTFSSYSTGKLSLSEENAKYSAWTVTTPSEKGNYRLTVTVVDLYGKSTSVTKYFKTLDVSPPTITVSSSESSSSVLENPDATIKFTGTVSDDGTVSSLCLAFLNPALSSDASNKIAYMSGKSTTAPWTSVSSGTASYTDSKGNIIYWIDLSEPAVSDGKNVYTFSKTLNLFTDLGIDGTTKTLEALDFVFRAEDSGATSSVSVFSLPGDTEAPVVSLDTLVLKDSNGSALNSYTFGDDETPTLPKIGSGYTAVLSGKWSDNSTSGWIDSYKLNVCDLDLTWNGNSISAAGALKKDGAWTVTVPSESLPTTSGVIKAKLTDYGGNSKTSTRSVFINGEDAGLESIGSNNDDGSYKAGSVIEITLDFTKATTMTYDASNPPTLTLNNGKTAAYSSGNGTAKHVYSYTVASGDDVDKLDVTKINDNGATWEDTDSETSFTVTLPQDAKRIGSTRNIKIDTVAPKISSVEAISSSGSYKAGTQILFMLSFSENVTLSNGESLALKFNNGAQTTSTAVSGSKVIFTYTVASGADTTDLQLDSLVSSEVTAVDEAENTVSDWTLPQTSLSGIIIDTTAPASPTVIGAWGSDSVVLDESGTTFKISYETGATIEYTIDGLNYQTYTGQVSLINNGTYTISARQTDIAGNISEESAPVTVTVDKGALLKKVSASTVSGTYSMNTNTKTVTGLIVFRKAVKIASGSTVTLNVKNNSSSYTGDKTKRVVDITNAGSEATSFNFTYTIIDGDYIENNGMLDVTGWSFNSVTLDSKEVGMAFDDVVDSGNCFTANREIYILTGVPTVQSAVLSGEGSEAVLTVTFDREISKVSGNITFTQDESTYRVPAVLTANEYGSIPTAAQSSYSKGVNGATLNSDNTLTNDTSTKYVLDYDTDIDDSTLIRYFISAKMHVITIPIVASAVEASGKVLTVTLGSTYELPTKGASYTLSIPAKAVTDEAQNKNEAYTTDGSTTKPHLAAVGVEAPVIRIQKSDYTIKNAGSTANATVTMPETAKMRIDCRTPGASIAYSKNESSSTQISVKGVTAYTTKTSDVVVSTSYSLYSSELTLGSTASSYDALKGLKIAVAAKSSKTINGTAYTSTSYEYATRTVLKFILDGSNKYDQNHYNDSVTVSDGTYNMCQLQIWVQGGDSASGTNSISTFPLSWGKETYTESGVTSEKFNYKLMHAYSNNKQANWTGTWAWVTWDLSTAAYHGFVAGDVPSDALKNGPKVCFAGECAWNALKGNYVLYPGETLQMCLTSDTDVSDKGAYFFRTKNKLTRD